MVMLGSESFFLVGLSGINLDYVFGSIPGCFLCDINIGGEQGIPRIKLIR
jgi:hypothetical protein